MAKGSRSAQTAEESFKLNVGQQIMELVNNYDLINKTFEFFWNTYDSYLIEDYDEAKEFGLINRDSVNVSLWGIEFELRNFDENMKHRFMTICVTLKFQHHDKIQKWQGTYECLFFMNGDIEDGAKDGEVYDNFFYIE